MEVEPRCTVVLAAAQDAERERLLRLLGGRFCVCALRCDPLGAFEAVHARRPDVVVCDAACAELILAELDAGDPPPSTWVVILAEELDGTLPQGLTRLPAAASDRRLLAAVSAAGRFARTGVHTRTRPTPAAYRSPPTSGSLADALERLAREADTG